VTPAAPSARPYDLVATDLDGTLLRSDDTVSERTRAALDRAAAAGAAHIVVTGRAAPWTRPILDAIGYTGIAVCGQGAQVYDAGAHKLITSVTLDRQLAAIALAKIEAEIGAVAVAASRDGVDGEVVFGPGYRVQEGLPAVIPVEACYLGWQQSLNNLATLIEPDIRD
jgi:HAD superfamily hydrolase (TIGR01484 family)